MAGSSRYEELLAIMARLRGPGGCPWDREQTRATLKKYIVEEAHEVLEAIDLGDPQALADELGDLLLQIVFQAQLGAEAGEFTMEDVLGKINAKLVRRHPHIFGEVRVSGAEEVRQNWEMIKKGEREQSSSLLDGVPRSLPALRRAARVQQRASSVGFDWDSAGAVLAKVEEEVRELGKALSAADRSLVSEELGDLIFSCVNLARHAGVEAEDSLNQAVDKFIRRFRSVEKALEKSGGSPGEASLGEMDALWDQAKREEGQKD